MTPAERRAHARALREAALLVLAAPELRSSQDEVVRALCARADEASAQADRDEARERKKSC